MQDILFIGCGRTASAIAKRLADLDSVGKIWLNSRTRESAGRLEQLIKDKKEVQVATDLSKIEIPEYVIMTLSTAPDELWHRWAESSTTNNEVRLHELMHNFSPVYMHGRLLKNIAEDRKIIVVTNPADVLTNCLKLFFGICNVYGFGMELDSERYHQILYSDSSARRPMCVGIHGVAVPILGWNDDALYQMAYEITDQKLLRHVKEKGIPYDFCAERFLDFFKKLSGENKSTVMMSTMLDGYRDISGVCMSVPVRVCNGKVIDFVPLDMNEVERNRFYNVKGQLEATLNAVKTFYSQYEDFLGAGKE